MVENSAESFYAKYLRLSLPFLLIVFLSMQVFALTTNDSNYSSGIYNGGFEYGTGTISGSGSSLVYFNYNNTFGWGCGEQFQEDANCYFSSFAYSGLQSMNVRAIRPTRENGVFAGGFATVAIDVPHSTPSVFKTNSGYRISLKPNTNYVLKSVSYNVDGNANKKCKIALQEFNSSGVYITETGNYNNSPNEWVSVNKSITTSSTTFFGSIRLQATSDVNTLDANCFFDDVRLEEVGNVNLTGQVSGRPTILVTGVSDFNAIDQADTNNSSSIAVGNNGARYSIAQSFTPNKADFTGLMIQIGASTGTPVGDLIFTLRDLNGTLPSDINLATKVVSASILDSLPQATDYKVEIPYILDANGSNKYVIYVTSSVQDANNFRTLRFDSGNSYSGGTEFDCTSTVCSVQARDLYFKTLFEKQSSAFDLNVCSSGDSVCESKTYDIDFLEDGETYTINPSDAPLFYAGDNNVYFMMHSDSDYNNTTPSMTAKIQYIFDKPTTTLTQTNNANDPTRQLITLTCTDGTTTNCAATYYDCGQGVKTYTAPFYVYNVYTSSCTYYSTGTNDNIEISKTTTINFYNAQNFQSNMCIKSINLPTNLFLIVFIVIIILIPILVTALRNPGEVSTGFISDNVGLILIVGSVLAIVLFIAIFFVLMGGVICSQVV